MVDGERGRLARSGWRLANHAERLRNPGRFDKSGGTQVNRRGRRLGVPWTGALPIPNWIAATEPTPDPSQEGNWMASRRGRRLDAPEAGALPIRTGNCPKSLRLAIHDLLRRYFTTASVRELTSS